MRKVEVEKGYFETQLKNGTIKTKEWRDDKQKLHRDNGPARITYEYSKEIKDYGLTARYWYNHGTLVHYESYDEWEILIRDRWYNADKQYHRLDGPAVIEYDEDGEIWDEEYYYNGKKCESEFELLVLHGLSQNSI